MGSSTQLLQMPKIDGLYVPEIEKQLPGVANVVSADQFSPDLLKSIFGAADEFRQMDEAMDDRRALAGRHVGRQICSLFYEPSTRTRLSFETAAVKMGMGVVSTENAREFSSAAKGETITDTVKVLNEYGFDAIVLRHHETGAAAEAASISAVPIINAGDGKGEHPTQSLLDAYTIHEHHNRLGNLNVVLGGDLKNGRTVRSLAQLLSKYGGNHFDFVSVPELQMGDDVKELLKTTGSTYEETEDLDSALEKADVIYWTRLQKERLDSDTTLEEVERIMNAFTITASSLGTLKDSAIIMHPLPRVGEIHPEVDNDPRAAYFRQAGNGLYVRMALLDLVLANTA